MDIVTVMVTFNRLPLLKQALESYERQSLLPKAMIIVDNGSTDGTKEYLQAWQSKNAPLRKIVIRLEENIGGSGGFHRGLQQAQKVDAQWCWIADDDAFLCEDAFETMDSFARRHPKLMVDTAALCGSVWTDLSDNAIDRGHRRRLSDLYGIPRQTLVEAAEYEKEYFPIDLFTYVGSMIRMDALKNAGLPQKDFFIYYDDLEHSYRVGKQGRLYCVPKCKVIHNAAVHQQAYGASWRSFYQSRNSLLFAKWHFPRYYKSVVAKRYLQKMILTPLGRYTLKNQMDFDAMQAARREELGVSPKYYIGWQAPNETVKK